MSEKPHGLPKAKVEKSYLTWSLWLIPIAAAAICGYFLAHDYLFSGPTITIYFQNADGLQEKDSMVKYLGINIGEIESLTLAKDRQQVVVKAKLYRSAAGVARQGSRFWVVRPEVKLGEISGLQTIVAGDYVSVVPGNGMRTNVFIGLPQAPIEPIQAMNIVLLAPELSSLEAQSPIFYRGVQVGEVISCQLGHDPRHVVINARIRQDYAPLVRLNSKFWNAGGINVHIGLFSGAQISAESAETLINGGIAFATPPDFGAPATNGTVFDLSEKQETAWKDWNPYIPLATVPLAMTNKTSLQEWESR